MPVPDNPNSKVGVDQSLLSIISVPLKDSLLVGAN